MATFIGQTIDAREIENATSQWSPEKFASMCDALIWAESGRKFQQQPSFTSRVNAPDDGIDAEWEIEIPHDESGLGTPILGPGWNVFQYKKRDLIAQDRRRIIATLKSSLKGAVAELERKTGKRPDRYIVCLNVDLKHDQSRGLREAILKGCQQPVDVDTQIVDAALLAALLNDHPHLKAAYFAPVSFKTWQEADRSHRARKLFRLDVSLTGREEELKRLRSLADDPMVRGIVVTGVHDVGKSHLVLEATRHRPYDVVFVLDPRSTTLEDYRNLACEKGDVLCVVEDPDPEGIGHLMNEVLGISGLKLIVTLPTTEHVPSPSYGLDDRIQSLRLGSLTDESSRKLLSETGRRFDFGLESWILDHAGGIPGVLLAAANVGDGLRKATVDFEKAVGREFEARIQSHLGEDALKCARLLSLLTHVGIAGKFESEIRVICELFGAGWERHHVLSTLDELEEFGLVKRGGSFVELTIPLVANHLAANLLRGRSRNELLALYAKLDGPGRLRLLRRLSGVKRPEVTVFWDVLFEHDAPLGGLKAALRKPHMLRFIAGAVPDRALQLLESGILGTSREERLAIANEPRRELMWALEQLLFRSETSKRALKLVWLLAEAENETWGNNASGVLQECFHPLHGQLPLPLDQRIEALREFMSEGSTEGKLVAIRAAGKALNRDSYTLRHSTGLEPLDKRPALTYADLYEYARDLVDILLDVAETETGDVAQGVLDDLPMLVAYLGVQGQPAEAVKRFKLLVDRIQSEKQGPEVADLSRAMDFFIRGMVNLVKNRKPDQDRIRELQRCRHVVERLKGRLEKSDFSIRLKLWVAGGNGQEHTKISIEGREVYRTEFEIEELAKEAVSDPYLCTQEVFAWLLAQRGKSHRFFYYLGQHDSVDAFSEEIEKVGSVETGELPFSAYWGGSLKNNRQRAEERLQYLASEKLITGNAVVDAAAFLGPSKTALALVKEQLSKGRVKPEFAAGNLYGDWIRDISDTDFLDLLRVIAGTEFTNAALAIDILRRWQYSSRPLEGELAELAWQVLESLPTVTSHDAYEYDQLAAALSKTDMDRAFKLLEKLLLQPQDSDRWNPIERYVSENRFWHALHAVDRDRALRTIFARALGPLQRFRVTSDLRDLLDQEADSDVLIRYAVEDERQAELVCESITASRPGFWPIAFAIIKNYPSSAETQNALTSGLEWGGDMSWGLVSDQLESSRSEVEKVLGDSSTPAAARPWLKEVLSRLEHDVPQHIVWEYDEDVNDLRRHIEDRDSPERLWAIGRILKYAEWKDVKRLLAVEDIEEALPQVDLPLKKRRALESAVEVWRGGS